MYIINKKGEIFNTDCIPAITTDGVTVYAVCNGTSKPISYDKKPLTTIAVGIRNHDDFVEVE